MVIQAAYIAALFALLRPRGMPSRGRIVLQPATAPAMFSRVTFRGHSSTRRFHDPHLRVLQNPEFYTACARILYKDVISNDVI